MRDRLLTVSATLSLFPSLCLGFQGSPSIINANIALSQRHAEFFSILVFLSVFAWRLCKRQPVYSGLFLLLLALHPAWWEGCTSGDGGFDKVENSFHLDLVGVVLLLAQLIHVSSPRLRTCIVTGLCLATLTPIVTLGIQPDPVMPAFDFCLLNAAAAGDHVSVNGLIADGAHVNARRKSHAPTRWEPVEDAFTRMEFPEYPFQIGYTPLMLACINGNRPTVVYLLDHGADVNATESEGGRTAADMAVQYNHRELVSLLLKHSARLRIKPELGRPNATE